MEHNRVKDGLCISRLPQTTKVQINKVGGPEKYANICELLGSAQFWQKCMKRDCQNLIEIVHDSSVMKLKVTISLHH